jgi:hypothetical protein
LSRRSLGEGGRSATWEAAAIAPQRDARGNRSRNSGSASGSRRIAESLREVTERRRSAMRERKRRRGGGGSAAEASLAEPRRRHEFPVPEQAFATCLARPKGFEPPTLRSEV